MDKPDETFPNQVDSHPHSIGNPYINIQLPVPSTSVVGLILGGIITLGSIFALTIAVARNADWKATTTKEDMAAYQRQVDARVGSLSTKYDLMHLWAQRAIVACEAGGMKMPPIPENNR